MKRRLLIVAGTFLAFSALWFYFHFKGTVLRPWDRDLVKAVITASFVDTSGQSLVQENAEVLLDLSHEPKDKFFTIRVLDNPKIAPCVLNVKWISKET